LLENGVLQQLLAMPIPSHDSPTCRHGAQVFDLLQTLEPQH
jgi:hypothetical protein